MKSDDVDAGVIVSDSRARASKGHISPKPFADVQFLFWAAADRGEKGFGVVSDRTITCRDCGQEFTFTAGEQAFYQERGYSEPQRCSSCRAERKAQRGSSGSGYDSGRSSGGGSSYSSGGGGYSSGGGGGYSSGGGGGYSSGPRQFY